MMLAKEDGNQIMGNIEKCLPESWIEIKLGEVCIVKDRFRKPINRKERKSRIKGKSTQELFPYYGATGLVGFIDDYLLDGEHILLGEDGAPFLDPYKDKAYLVSGKIWVNNHAHILEAIVSNKYLLYFLNHVNYSKYVTGTTRLKLNQSSMVGIPVRFAPQKEQHRIVEKIEELFSEIDKGTEYLRTAKEQIEVYRQAVLKAAFEGNLTLSWRQRQNIRNIEQALCDIKRPENEVIRMLAEIPDEWRYVFLSSLGELSRGKSRHRPRNDERLFKDGIYPFIQTGEVKAARKYISEYSQTYNDFGLSQSRLWPKGTLCITIAANIAETAFLGFDACFPDSIVGFVADDDKIAIEYIYYFFNYSQKRIEAYAPATAQKNINLTTLENIVVPYCSKEEQHQIVQEIESRLSVCEHMEETIEKGLAQAESLKQSILKKAFEGRLVPQDPDDEPAAVLLERIRKEKKRREEALEARAKKTKKGKRKHE